MPRIPQLYNKNPFSKQWEGLPRRIFLDSNVVQYLSDFGEFIYDNYRENGDHLKNTRGKIIKRGARLHQEIEALKDIFSLIGRTNIELAISDVVYQELSAKNSDPHLLVWVNDLVHYWNDIIQSHDAPFSAQAKKRYLDADRDTRMTSNFSSQDRDIILDAIRLDCNALLTVDRFADEKNQNYLQEKYQLMVLWPSDFMEILTPFRALF